MLRPAQVCRQLLDALDASEGRRRRRKRNTTPDAIGLDLRRDLLHRAIHDDPSPEQFEAWLEARCPQDRGGGPVRAMARSILEDWQLALASPGFHTWLKHGAPSDDAGAE
ncbi:MAG TPA: hypothetical protein VD793_06935 [Gemmatimonadales bacterium]|nr:hypothetical protein [Gemmatimonadales bacterium]